MRTLISLGNGHFATQQNLEDMKLYEGPGVRWVTSSTEDNAYLRLRAFGFICEYSFMLTDKGTLLFPIALAEDLAELGL